MNIKTILSEVKDRGEKIKNDVLTEILKSHTLQEIVSNKHFINALTRVIQTKDEVKKAINVQIHHLFNVMDVPSREELMKLAGKLGNLEKIIEAVGRNRIAVSILPKLRTQTQTSRVKRSSLSRSASAASKKRTSTAKKRPARKAPAKAGAPAAT